MLVRTGRGHGFCHLLVRSLCKFLSKPTQVELEGMGIEVGLSLGPQDKGRLKDT